MTQGFDDVSKDRVYFAKAENGKFYRGAKLFMWTRYWRRAAAMRYEDWRFLRDQKKIPWSTVLMTLEEVIWGEATKDIQ